MKFSDLTVLRDRLPILEREVRRIVHKDLKDRRMQVLVNSTLPIETLNYDGFKFPRKYFDLATLVLIIHYSEYFGEFKGYLQYEIELYLDKLLLFPDIRASLYEPKLALFILLHQSRWSTEVLFGNLLNEKNLLRIVSLVHLRILKPHKIKYPIRRRSYKDKGTLRPKELWLPSKDSFFDEQEELLERRKNEYFETVHLLIYEAGSLVLQNHLMSNSSQGGEEK